MKFNWGTGIVLTLVVFVSGMMLLVYLSFQQKINLVSHEYYPKGLIYEDHITKVKNTAALKKQVKIEESNKIIKITYPKFFLGKQNEGTVLIYRPSDFELDQKFKMVINESLVQQIRIEELIKGKYYVKLEWISDSVAYYYEKDIYIK